MAGIARKFGATYETTVYRLRALDVLSRPETKHLAAPERRKAAVMNADLFTANAESEQLRSADADIEVKSEIAHLGIEAYRRQLIDKSALTALVPKLQIPGLTAARLLELAEAAR